MNTRHDNQLPTGPFDAVNRRFMRLVGEDGGPLMKLWGLIAGFNLMVVMLSAVIQVQTNAPMMHEVWSNPGAYTEPVQTSPLVFLLYPLLAIAGAMYWASFRAVRSVDEEGAGVSFSDASSLMFDRIIPVGIATIGFGLLTGLGTMCCIIPGLFAMYYFYQAPYLVAEGMSVGAAFNESMERAKRHAPLVFLLIAISVIAGFGSALLQFFAIGLFDGAMGSAGTMLGSFVAWAMGSIIGYFMWLYAGSVFVTISKAEENMRRPLGRRIA